MILFDTSVLVAATVQTHIRHERGRRAVLSVKEGRTKGFICQHSLAEFFNTLTRYKMDLPASPRMAEEIILKNLLPAFAVVPLTQKDYLAAIRRLREKGLRGPIVYDALIVQAALKKKAEAIYTFNPPDFERLVDGEIAIREPV